MGKKSRRKRDKDQPINPGTKSDRTSYSTVLSGGLLPLSTIASRVPESLFENPFEDEPTPKRGWARELREAERELRRDAGNPASVFRAARAARAVRRFDKLERVLAKARSSGGAAFDSDERRGLLLRRWEEECEARRGRSTCVNEPQIRSLISSVMKWGGNLDTTHIEHPQSFLNENAIQCAVSMGDVRLFEKVVALGAALDFSGVVTNASTIKRDGDSSKVKKPPGSTALLLAVIQAISARHCMAIGGEDERMRDAYEGEIECAIQLVRLGANVNVRLQLPTGRDAKSKTYKMLTMMRLSGKTVRELARETGSELLVKTIESFDAAEDKIKLVNCRCGSRLPWSQCHAGLESDRHYLYLTKDGDSQSKRKLLWKRSPLGPCPCQNTRSVYFKCCWDEAAFREYYQDHETGELLVCYRTPVSENKEYVMDMYRRSANDDELSELAERSQTEHPKSKIGTWDRRVVEGVKKRTDSHFSWNDIHWIIPKPELLKRAAEWNGALERYCDDEGLVGAEREEVIELHKASPFAPCANANCARVETRVKEFSRCSRCLSVSYCSEACLKEDYPFHKKKCRKR